MSLNLSDFKAGARVKYIGSQSPWLRGLVGTISDKPFSRFGDTHVDWDTNKEHVGGVQLRNLALVDEEPAEVDMVNNPPHYTAHPSGVECIEITRHMGFNVGNAVKYLWRADLKGAAIQDLEKAAFYIQDEITKRKAASA